MIALVDCNNFYASCERLFRPKLKTEPIVVLSNNDGCVIARSNEAKSLGIDMTAPLYKIKDRLKQLGVHIFSSNYELYGDMSSRVMSTLGTFSPEQEVYSIDESFLDLSHIPLEQLESYCHNMRETVWENTGLPVSIGVATTKTLAKIANHIAKKGHGVCCFYDSQTCDYYLREHPVDDIWGIGRRTVPKLQQLGIRTASDLAKADPQLFQKKFSIMMSRTIHELNEVSVFGLDEQPAAQQSICSSKSFGRAVTNIDDMLEAAASYATSVASKLRNNGLYAGQLIVYLETHNFKDRSKCYRNSGTRQFAVPSSSTGAFVKKSCEIIKQIFRDGYNYKKCGVIAVDLVDRARIQDDLFTEVVPEDDSLDAVLDDLTRKFGKQSISYASTGIERSWSMKRSYQSPRYTTQWEELLKV